MNISETKPSSSFGDEEDDAALNKLIDSYGVTGILSTLVAILSESAEETETKEEATLLRLISDDLTKSLLRIKSRL